MSGTAVRSTVICALLLAAPVIIVVAQEAEIDKRDFHPRRLLPEQPPIIHFEVKSVDDVGTKLHHTELVLGVVIGDESRAYPINMLTSPHREIVNDRLGDQPIAATW